MKKKIKEKITKLFCAIFDHSKIHENCIGYKYCGRCGTEVGDSLMGVYDGKHTVIVGHNCSLCIINYKNLTWIDKFMVPWPFKKEK